MQATKNQAVSRATLCVALAVILAGCTPAGPRALLDGKRLLEDGKYDLAVARLRTATTLLTTNAHAWNYLGLACHRGGQLTNAVQSYQKALDLSRDLLEARYNLGCAWLDLNRPELAKAEFTSYVLRRGNAAEGWLKLGTAQLRVREFTAAERSFREALRLSPNYPEALNGLGLIQAQHNRFREAAQFFSAALKLEPEYRPALLNLAIVLQQSLNDRTTALEKYREYLTLKPRSSDWESVNTIAESLTRQLAPPPRVAPTNRVLASPPAAGSNFSLTTTTRPSTQTTPPKTSVASSTRKPAPSPPLKLEPARTTPNAVAPNPAAHTSTVEVVTLPPEPIIRTRPETPPVATQKNQKVMVAQPANTYSTPVAPRQDSTIEKSAKLARTSPTNSLRREPDRRLKSDAIVDLPEGTGTSSTSNLLLTGAGAGVPSVAASIPSADRRYKYLSPVKPEPGNRREAERAFAQGQQAHRANRLAEATQAYRQATQVDPSYFEAYYNLGLVTFESRSYRQSLAAWEDALTLQPESVDVRYNFALALKAANYPVDAANELNRILTVNTNETRAHLVLGNLFAEQFDNPAQARRHYLKVLEQDPRHPQATTIRFWLVANPP